MQHDRSETVQVLYGKLEICDGVINGVLTINDSHFQRLREVHSTELNRKLDWSPIETHARWYTACSRRCYYIGVWIHRLNIIALLYLKPPGSLTSEKFWMAGKGSIPPDPHLTPSITIHKVLHSIRPLTPFLNPERGGHWPGDRYPNKYPFHEVYMRCRPIDESFLQGTDQCRLCWNALAIWLKMTAYKTLINLGSWEK